MSYTEPILNLVISITPCMSGSIGALNSPKSTQSDFNTSGFTTNLNSSIAVEQQKSTSSRSFGHIVTEALQPATTAPSQPSLSVITSPRPVLGRIRPATTILPPPSKVSPLQPLTNASTELPNPNAFRKPLIKNAKTRAPKIKKMTVEKRATGKMVQENRNRKKPSKVRNIEKSKSSDFNCHTAKPIQQPRAQKNGHKMDNTLKLLATKIMMEKRAKRDRIEYVKKLRTDRRLEKMRDSDWKTSTNEATDILQQIGSERDRKSSSQKKARQRTTRINCPN